MRPLALVLAGILAVAAAYGVVFWRNASDVRQQLEDEQAEVAPQELRLSAEPVDRSQANSALPPKQQDSGPPSELGSARATWGTSVEGSPANSESAPTPVTASQGPETPTFDVEAEQKRLNYVALESTSIRIGSAIQRQMREGEILRRGRGIGAVLLRHLGYGVNAAGEHETPDGTFSVDIKGPDLIVLTATSEDVGNQLEMSIIGPRDVDRRIRRVR